MVAVCQISLINISFSWLKPRIVVLKATHCVCGDSKSFAELVVEINAGFLIYESNSEGSVRDV